MPTRTPRPPEATPPHGGPVGIVEATERAAAAGLPTTPVEQATVKAGAAHTDGRYVVRTDQGPGILTYVAPGDDVPADLAGLPIVDAGQATPKPHRG